jgi:hypothetical protein
MEAGYLKAYGYRHRLNAGETKESRMRCASYVHASHMVTPLARCVRDRFTQANYTALVILLTSLRRRSY